MPGGDEPEQDAWISPESQAQSVQLPHGSFLLHTGHMACKAYLSKLACMVLVCKRPGISRVEVRLSSKRTKFQQRMVLRE